MPLRDKSQHALCSGVQSNSPFLTTMPPFPVLRPQMVKGKDGQGVRSGSQTSRTGGTPTLLIFLGQSRVNNLPNTVGKRGISIPPKWVLVVFPLRQDMKLTLTLGVGGMDQINVLLFFLSKEVKSLSHV